jgi:hypothetical protein
MSVVRPARRVVALALGIPVVALAEYANVDAWTGSPPILRGAIVRRRY